MKKSTLKALLVILLILAAASSLLLYITHSTPTEEEILVPVLTYDQTGRFNCVARLKPNLIYNQTTLKPEEGILYMRITEDLSITFTYTFALSQPANITVTHSLNTAIVSSAGWNKTYVVPLEVSPLNFIGKNAELTFSMTVDPDVYAETVKEINKETGTTSQDYILVIKPRIQTVAKTGGHTIEEDFEPALEVKVQYRTQSGDIYSIEGLEHKNQKAITEKQTIYHPEVIMRRYASYAIAIITFTALTYTLWQFSRARGYITMTTVEEEIKPFREIIAKIAEKPLQEGNRTTVRMKTLQDLAKISEELIKPILHEEPIVEKGGSKMRCHIFYVLDGDVRYEFTFEEMVEAKKMKHGDLSHVSILDFKRGDSQTRYGFD